jgi:4-amino-4-deoxy-L-arabinose transferase-like glycosyltransferase
LKIPAWILEGLLLLCLLAVVFPLAMATRTGQFREPDTRENLQIALNLLRYKVYSVLEAGNGIPPKPTTKREPLYPILLSLWMAALRDENSFADPPTLDSLDPGFAYRLKSLNVILHLGLVLASWWAARSFFGRPWPALAVAVLVAFNSSMLSTIDVFLTEIPAALLLASSSALIWLTYSRKSVGYAILGGLSLGALALTRAVFFYFVVLAVAGAAVWLAAAQIRQDRQQRPAAARWGLMALVALAVYSPWFVRNQRLGETLQVDERGEDVLAIRAEYSTMNWRQYAASFFYFTPSIGPRLTASIFGEDTARGFDRSRPESFFQRALSGAGEVQRTATASGLGTRQAAVRVMAEHLPMMALLSLPFAYRGAFVQVGFNVKRVPAALLYFTLLYSAFFVPALVVLILRLVRQRDPRWLFLVPALYSYAFHSLITHYIPRYSVPLVPIFLLALVSVIGLKHEAGRTDTVFE